MLAKGAMFSSLANAWYPVAISRQLKPGQHRAIRLFDTQWLLFRTRSGRAGVTSRYCCHLGTDLANGCVIGEDIECPAHGWRYAVDGSCTLIPRSESIPDSARLFSLPVEERYGVVYAFYGDRPLFDFPRFEELPGKLDFSAPVVVPLQAPYHVVALNTFDAQHYEKVHARRFVGSPDISRPGPYRLRIDYTAEIIQRRWVDRLMAKLSGATTSVTIETWSAGIMLLHNRDTRFGSIIGVCPSGENRCELYIVALKAPDPDRSWAKSRADSVALGVAAQLLKHYLAPDLKIIANMRPHRGALLDGVDDALASFFDFWRELPKTPVLGARDSGESA